MSLIAWQSSTMLLLSILRLIGCFPATLSSSFIPRIFGADSWSWSRFPFASPCVNRVPWGSCHVWGWWSLLRLIALRLPWTRASYRHRRDTCPHSCRRFAPIFLFSCGAFGCARSMRPLCKISYVVFRLPFFSFFGLQIAAADVAIGKLLGVFFN